MGRTIGGEMCRTYWIRSEADDDKHTVLVDPVEYPPEDAEHCACGMTADDEEWRKFCEVLRPFIDETSWGNVVIEVR